MLKFFYEGGPLFMGILTLVLLAVIIISILEFRNLNNQSGNYNGGRIKSFGLLALIIGIFGQLIGLYAGFETIEASGDVSQSMLAGGIKVSMITTMYGMFIFLCSLVVKMILDWRSKTV